MSGARPGSAGAGFAPRARRRGRNRTTGVAAQDARPTGQWAREPRTGRTLARPTHAAGGAEAARVAAARPPAPQPGPSGPSPGAPVEPGLRERAPGPPRPRPGGDHFHKVFLKGLTVAVSALGQTVASQSETCRLLGSRGLPGRLEKFLGRQPPIPPAPTRPGPLPAAQAPSQQLPRPAPPGPAPSHSRDQHGEGEPGSAVAARSVLGAAGPARSSRAPAARRPAVLSRRGSRGPPPQVSLHSRPRHHTPPRAIGPRPHARPRGGAEARGRRRERFARGSEAARAGGGSYYRGREEEPGWARAD